MQPLVSTLGLRPHRGSKLCADTTDPRESPNPFQLNPKPALKLCSSKPLVSCERCASGRPFRDIDLEAAHVVQAVIRQEVGATPKTSVQSSIARAYPRIPAHTRAYPRILAHTRAYPALPKPHARSRAFPPQCKVAATTSEASEKPPAVCGAFL